MALPNLPITDTANRIVFAGDLSLRNLIVLGAVLVIGIIGFTLWEARRSAHTRLWMLLLPLRLGMAAILLWMLAGPALETTTHDTFPRTVGVLIDDSASMGVVDPPETRGVLSRWTAQKDDSSEVAQLDRASAMLQVASSNFHRFNLTRISDPLNAAGRARAAAETTGRVLPLMDALKQKSLPGAGEFATEMTEIHRSLSKHTAPEIQALADQAQKGPVIDDPDRPQRVTEAEEQLERLARRLTRLSESVSPSDLPAQQLDKPAKEKGTKSRIESIAALLGEGKYDWVNRIEQNGRILGWKFDNAVHPLTPSDWSQALAASSQADSPEAMVLPAGMATDLSAAIEQLAGERAAGTLEAAVLFSDGGHNGAADPVQAAAALAGLPLYVVPIGNSQSMRDVVLHHVDAPRTVFQNDQILIEGMVDAFGCVGAELNVSLIQDEKVIETQTFEVTNPSFMRRFNFARKAEKLGTVDYSVRVEAVTDEQVADNNQAAVSVDVTESKIRVLLADQSPRWEFRYLRNLFKRDQHIEFAEILFEPGDTPGRPGGAAGFPKTLDDWSQYRLVILGDVSPQRLDPATQAMLVDYVDKRGGTLIIIAGDHSMPAAYGGSDFEKLVPVEIGAPARTDPAGYGVQLTGEGRSFSALQLDADPARSEQVWREVSSRLPVYDLSPISRPRPTSHVLMSAAPMNANLQSSSGKNAPTADQPAFLCWQSFGRGRTVYLAAPETYKLRFRNGDRYHHLFWGQLMRWAVAREAASGSRTVRIATDKPRYTQGEAVQAIVYLNQQNGSPVEGGRVRVAAHTDEKILASVDLKEDEDRPGVYRGELPDLAIGQWTLDVEGETPSQLLASEKYDKPVSNTILVDPMDALELRDTRCNLPLLRKLAESTGGAILPPTALAAAMGELDLAPRINERKTQAPLWDRWINLWLFVGFAGVEWILRKRFGMA